MEIQLPSPQKKEDVLENSIESIAGIPNDAKVARSKQIFQQKGDQKKRKTNTNNLAIYIANEHHILPNYNTHHHTLTLQSIDLLDAGIYVEIRTRIPDTISWDYNFEFVGSTPLTFTVKITLQPTPPSVTFRGDGHGDFTLTITICSIPIFLIKVSFFQIDFTYYANIDILIAFHCDCQVSHRYKNKFLKATTSNIPSSVIRDNRGSKLTISRGGLLKVQHLVLYAGYQLPSRIAYIEFFVKLEEDEGTADD
ncbi:hypothetical protein UlMin_037256 [Ulmus minor]